MLNQSMQTLRIPKGFRLAGFTKANIIRTRPRPISDLALSGIGFLPDMLRRLRPVLDLVCPGIGFLLQNHVHPSPQQRLGFFVARSVPMQITLTPSLVLVQVPPGIEVPSHEISCHDFGRAHAGQFPDFRLLGAKVRKWSGVGPGRLEPVTEANLPLFNSEGFSEGPVVKCQHVHMSPVRKKGDVGPFKTEALAAYPPDMCEAVAEALLTATLAWKPSVLKPLKSLPVGGDLSSTSAARMNEEESSFGNHVDVEEFFTAPKSATPTIPASTPNASAATQDVVLTGTDKIALGPTTVPPPRCQAGLQMRQASQRTLPRNNSANPCQTSRGLP